MFVLKTNDINWKEKTILIVEDEDLNYKLIYFTLYKTGVNLIWAKNGIECIELIRNNSETIDVILMDIKMPKMDGIETTKILKKDKVSVPVIMQSAFTADYKTEKEVACLFDDYLAKPFKPKELVDVVVKYLN